MSSESVTTASMRRLAWPLLFGAVLAQLPGLRAWFAQDDWDSLARVTGHLDVDALAIRPLSTVWSWKLLHLLFGLDAVSYHAVALLGFGLLVVFALRVGRRVGLSTVGLAISGLWLVATPFVLRPISWASASGEIWAALFALIAVDLWWLRSSPARPWPLAAIAAAVLSLSAKESGLVLPVVLALISLWWPAQDAPNHRRARGMLLGLLALVSIGVAVLVARHFASGGLGAYATGGPVTVLQNLATAGAWLLTPFAGWPLVPSTGLQIAGAALWVIWLLDAATRWRRGDRQTAFSLIVAIGAMAPVLALDTHFESYYLLLTTCALGWWLGSWGERRLPRRLRDDRIFVLVLVATVSMTALRTQGAVSARDEDGRMTDPILRRSSIALESSRLLRGLPKLSEVPMIAVLQATRVELPDDAEIPEGASVILTTPVHRALRGSLGLKVLLPEGVGGRWVTNLEGLPLDTVVLLDTGDDHLRVLGPLENARLYSALIAVAAGQFPRARHDLWSVIGKLGAEVRFAYRRDNLPLTPAELDARAEAFVRFLEADDEASSRRILKLFAQLYEAVRGQALFDQDWLAPRRAPRSDG